MCDQLDSGSPMFTFLCICAWWLGDLRIKASLFPSGGMWLVSKAPWWPTSLSPSTSPASSWAACTTLTTSPEPCTRGLLTSRTCHSPSAWTDPCSAVSSTLHWCCCVNVTFSSVQQHLQVPQSEKQDPRDGLGQVTCRESWANHLAKSENLVSSCFCSKWFEQIGAQHYWLKFWVDLRTFCLSFIQVMFYFPPPPLRPLCHVSLFHRNK